MKRKTFKTTINASSKKVWEVLWNDRTYPQWTAPFCEGSHAVTDWNEGSKVLFLGPDGNGMVSKIKTKRPHGFMSFEHQGIVKDGVEYLDAKEAEQWAGAMEDYALEEADGTTTLTVEVDIAAAYMDSFQKAFPKALQQVKELSEG